MVNSDKDLEALLAKIEQRFDPVEVRRDAARYLLSHLTTKGSALDSWEKMHFEMAIALLPTVWLRLALTHIKLALDPVAERPEMDPERAEQFEGITYEQLVARLTDLRS